MNLWLKMILIIAAARVRRLGWDLPMRSVASEKHHEPDANFSASHPNILESKMKLFERSSFILAEV